ncbi:MAG: radical SAM protein [Bacillota bacterium]|uniref:radical SAM protein n=1 Tax=Desulforamulus profundi TaxID=1383067 RepID=UPI000BFF97E1
MNDIIKCERTELTITHRCNLRCKLCGAYSPYYSPTPHWGYDDLAKSVIKYFEVVDYVEKFTLSGGEPLLHP